MTTFRYRDQGPSGSTTLVSVIAGAVAGFAVGVLVAQRAGGLKGIAARLRQSAERGLEAGREGFDAETYEPDELESGDDADDEEGYELEERVLEAFRNDPVLSERAIDIGAVATAIVELSGWVEDEGEAEHAVTVARGVPGIETVVNRLTVREEEEEADDAAERFAAGDPALTEARWEGQQVGTGRRRQGTSADPDRHADPKVTLEDRWLSAEEALREAADETAGISERRSRAKKAAAKGGRTDGSPVAPSGVPKGDHVANPTKVDPHVVNGDLAREVQRDAARDATPEPRAD
ncbi:MAG TPA: BON domain-containing protein [Gemmatimonadaceae bacterium]|nr:BON domain-containing protein [Gemmatimonadaceae bacterium]